MVRSPTSSVAQMQRKRHVTAVLTGDSWWINVGTHDHLQGEASAKAQSTSRSSHLCTTTGLDGWIKNWWKNPITFASPTCMLRKWLTSWTYQIMVLSLCLTASGHIQLYYREYWEEGGWSQHSPLHHPRRLHFQQPLDVSINKPILSGWTITMYTAVTDAASRQQKSGLHNWVVEAWERMKERRSWSQSHFKWLELPRSTDPAVVQQDEFLQRVIAAVHEELSLMKKDTEEELSMILLLRSCVY